MPSLLESEILDHRIPTGAVVCEPEICGNCSRRLYVTKKDKRICPGCSSAFEIGAQVWACMDCGTARKWGEDKPDFTASARLKCARCRLVTEHEFIRVSRGQ